MDDEPWESIPWDFDDYLDDAHDAWAVGRDDVFLGPMRMERHGQNPTDLSFSGQILTQNHELSYER